jgi:DnaJ-class molecular chaperone
MATDQPMNFVKSLFRRKQESSASAQGQTSTSSSKRSRSLWNEETSLYGANAKKAGRQAQAMTDTLRRCWQCNGSGCYGRGDNGLKRCPACKGTGSVKATK